LEKDFQSDRLQAEFDLVADEYHAQHKKNLAITGESPEYFAEYKIQDLAHYIRAKSLPDGNIFDFGCGIGNSVEYFRKYFPESELCCGDVSTRSMEIARARFSARETYVHIETSIPLPSESQDIVFTACVFHHIPHEEHQKWLLELNRIIRPGGVLAIYEHNPLNPLTVRAVKTCPFDVNAKLIRGGVMKRRALIAGWREPHIRYKLFFPSFLRFFRPLEKYLSRICLGAQWRLISRK
jgi:SAM-dependent methyltransferase